MSTLTLLVNVFIHGLALAAVLFAFTFGRKAERIGAGVYTANLALVGLSQIVGKLVFDEGYPVIAFVAVDLATAVSFAVLAVHQQDKLWPGAASCAQYSVFVFSVAPLVDFPLHDALNAHAVNVSAMLVQAILIAGTIKARWGRPKLDEWEQYAMTLDKLEAKPA